MSGCWKEEHIHTEILFIILPSMSPRPQSFPGSFSHTGPGCDDAANDPLAKRSKPPWAHDQVEEAGRAEWKKGLWGLVPGVPLVLFLHFLFA